MLRLDWLCKPCFKEKCRKVTIVLLFKDVCCWVFRYIYHITFSVTAKRQLWILEQLVWNLISSLINNKNNCLSLNNLFIVGTDVTLQHVDFNKLIVAAWCNLLGFISLLKLELDQFVNVPVIIFSIFYLKPQEECSFHSEPHMLTLARDTPRCWGAWPALC